MSLSAATITLDGVEVYDPRPLLRYSEARGLRVDHWLRKVNSFVLPRGRQFGRGSLLFTRSALFSLLTGGEDPLNAFDHTLKFEVGSDSVEIQNLGIYRAEALTATDEKTDETLYLVHLRDRRHLGQFTSLNKAYNVYVQGFPASNYFTVTTNGGSAWTWATMLSDLESKLSVVGTFDRSLADYPTLVPEGYRFHGVTAWEAYNRVLDDCRLVVVPTGTQEGNSITFDGNYSVVKLYAVDPNHETRLSAALPNNVDLSWDERGTALVVPETVRVFFPKEDFAFQVGSDTDEVSGKIYQANDPLVLKDIATSSILADSTTISGTIKVLHAPLFARYDYSGAITNQSEIDAFAEDLASNWLNAAVTSSPLHNIYFGVHPFAPSSQITAVAFWDVGEPLGIHTEIILSPREFEPAGFPGSYASAMPEEAVNAFHANEYPGSPDLARQHQHQEILTVVRDEAGAEGSTPASALVLYGVNADTSINWTSATRFIDIFDSEDIAIFHHQTQRWLKLPTGSSDNAQGRLSADLACEDTCAAVECVVGACNSSPPSEACNPYGLQGEEGDLVHLQRLRKCRELAEGCDEYAPCADDYQCATESETWQWVIVQVEHKPVCVPLEAEFRLGENDAKCLVWGKANFAQMFSSRRLTGELIGNACCGEDSDESYCACVDIVFDPFAPSCCGGGAGCGCDDLPAQVTAILTNNCGTVEITLSRVNDDCSGTCSPRYEGSGELDCRLDAYTACGQAVTVNLIWCVGTPCTITIECELNGTTTDVFQLSSCDPVYGFKEMDVTGWCTLCTEIGGLQIEIVA